VLFQPRAVSSLAEFFEKAQKGALDHLIARDSNGPTNKLDGQLDFFSGERDTQKSHSIFPNGAGCQLYSVVFASRVCYFPPYDTVQ
jgi:hypothetical protein